MANLSIFTSTTQDGNVSFKWGRSAMVIKNREAFLAKHDLSLQQTVALHTQDLVTIQSVSGLDAGRGMTSLKTAVKADAILTQSSNLALWLLTADCLPLVIFDPQTQTLGIAHLSLKTIDQQLPTLLVAYCAEHYGCQTKNLQMHIGPGIHQGSYQRKHWSHKKYPAWQPYVIETTAHTWAIDLHGYVLSQLLTAGIDKAHIFLDPTNTYTSPEYFSHSRSKDQQLTEGRFATVAIMS